MATIKYTIFIFLKKNLNHIVAFFKINDEMRSQGDLRAKLGLDDNKKFDWRQIIHAIPRAWKEIFLECGSVTLLLTNAT